MWPRDSRSQELDPKLVEKGLAAEDGLILGAKRCREMGENDGFLVPILITSWLSQNHRLEGL